MTPRGPKIFLKLGKSASGGIVDVLRLFLGIQVIQVAEELVEAVGGGQVLVLVAEVVLAELAGGVAQRLEQLGNGGVLRLQPDVRAGHAHLGEAGAVGVLPGDEGGAAGGAALLAVRVGEAHPLVGDAVDVGGAVAHQPIAVAAQVGDADVVAPDDEDVGFSVWHDCRSFLGYSRGPGTILAAPFPEAIGGPGRVTVLHGWPGVYGARLATTVI